MNGPLPTLNSLQLEDVRVIVDLLDLDVGVHLVSPLILIAPTDVEHDPVFPSTIRDHNFCRTPAHSRYLPLIEHDKTSCRSSWTAQRREVHSIQSLSRRAIGGRP